MLALWLTAGLLAGTAEAPVVVRRFGGSAPVRMPAVHVKEVEHEPLALEVVKRTLADVKKEREAPATEQLVAPETKPDLGALFGVSPTPQITPPEAPVKVVPTAEVLDAVYGQGHEIEFLLLLAA